MRFPELESIETTERGSLMSILTFAILNAVLALALVIGLSALVGAVLKPTRDEQSKELRAEKREQFRLAA